MPLNHEWVRTLEETFRCGCRNTNSTYALSVSRRWHMSKDSWYLTWEHSPCSRLLISLYSSTSKHPSLPNSLWGHQSSFFLRRYITTVASLHGLHTSHMLWLTCWLNSCSKTCKHDACATFSYWSIRLLEIGLACVLSGLQMQAMRSSLSLPRLIVSYLV